MIRKKETIRNKSERRVGDKRTGCARNSVYSMHTEKPLDAASVTFPTHT